MFNKSLSVLDLPLNYRKSCVTFREKCFIRLSKLIKTNKNQVKSSKILQRPASSIFDRVLNTPVLLLLLKVCATFFI